MTPTPRAIVQLDRARELLRTADAQTDPNFARTLTRLAIERVQAAIVEARCSGPARVAASEWEQLVKH